MAKKEGICHKIMSKGCTKLFVALHMCGVAHLRRGCAIRVPSTKMGHTTHVKRQRVQCRCLCSFLLAIETDSGFLPDAHGSISAGGGDMLADGRPFDIVYWRAMSGVKVDQAAANHSTRLYDAFGSSYQDQRAIRRDREVADRQTLGIGEVIVL